MWKKIGIAVLVLVLLAGIGTGIYFIVKASQDNAKSAEVYQEIDFLEDSYTEGEKIVLRAKFQDDKAFTSIKYSIDSGEEKALESTTGETADNEDLDGKNGDFYIDSGIETLDTTGLKTGTHVLQIYTVQDNVQILQYEHIFTIKAAA